jgi:cystathionine gamma-synthase
LWSHVFLSSRHRSFHRLAFVYFSDSRGYNPPINLRAIRAAFLQGLLSRGAKSMKFETLAVHAGQSPDPAYGAVMTPIYQSSTFAFKGVNKPGEFDYSRSGNPTRKALETCLAALEDGTRGFAFATGMAAEATVLVALLKAGDHILIHDDLYGGTYRLITKVIVNHGVAADFVNMRDLQALDRAIKPNTKMLWTETPTNPLMNLLDLSAIAQLAKRRGVLTVCDNTFLSPYFQRPLALGIDVVVHSTTKYINGHSDVVGGAAIVSDPKLAEPIAFHQNAMGTCAGPQDCFLVMRGVKTLPLRMEQHNRKRADAGKVAPAASENLPGAAPRFGKPSPARPGQAPDHRLWRDVRVPCQRRPRPRLPDAWRGEAVHARRIARRR